MQIKLLQSLVEELASADSGKIVDILFDKKDVNEFLIAKKMDMTINQIRNILYKLSAEGLVSFIRKKDKRKGWYIYYWTLKTENCLEKLESSLLKKIAELNFLLKSRETKRFYICSSCHIEVSEETALEHGFTCEECAEVYELVNNSKSIKETKAKITRTQRDLNLIQKELESVREKQIKKRARAERKEKKKIKAEKKSKRKVKKKAKKKPKKKIKKAKKKIKPKKTKKKKPASKSKKAKKGK